MTRYALLDADGYVRIVADMDVQPDGPHVELDDSAIAPPCPSEHHRLRIIDGRLAWVDLRTLEQAKAAKKAEINAAHEGANLRFQYVGQWFQADAQSWQQITAVQGWVSDCGELPPDFPGYWKAEDNALIPIADAATWRQFYAAAIARGTANFWISETLKNELALASSVADADAVRWPDED